MIEVEPIPSSRGKQVRLTSRGLDAQARFAKGIEAAHDDFRRRPETEALSETLGQITGQPLASSKLAEGMVPPSTGWRATVTTHALLPDHPIVLGRGGWPDGS